MQSTTSTRFVISSGRIYLPYGGSDITVTDNEGSSVVVAGLPQPAIQDAILDNISSRRWADNEERKAAHLDFVRKVREAADRVIDTLAPAKTAEVES